MATINATQLADRVLRQLRLVGEGQIASAGWTKKVTDAWTSLYHYLRRHGYAPWGSGAIAEEAQEPVTRWVAWKVSGKWGFSPQSQAKIRTEGMDAWRELQELYNGERSVLPTRPRYH